MKRLLFVLTTIILLFASTTIGQNYDSDNCNQVLLLTGRDQYSYSDYTRIQEDFYFIATHEEEEIKQAARSRSRGLSFSAMIYGSPTGGDWFDNNNYNSNFIRRVKDHYEETSSFDQSSSIAIYSDVANETAINAWKDCMNEKLAGAGDWNATFDRYGDMVLVTVLWRPADVANSLDRKVIAAFSSSNLKRTGDYNIYQNANLSKGTALIEQFRIANPDEPAIISIGLEGLGTPKQLTIDPVVNNVPSPATQPIGTIVASIIPFEEFTEAFGEPEFNPSESKWAPCNGYGIAGSDLSALGYTFTPDLRGMFLRGNAEMWKDNDPGSQHNILPDTVGRATFVNYSYQKGALEEHQHFLFGDGRPGNNDQNPADWIPNHADAPVAWATQGISHVQYRMEVGVAEEQAKYGITSTSGTASETRPMNMTVYYYIRINN